MRAVLTHAAAILAGAAMMFAISKGRVTQLHRKHGAVRLVDARQTTGKCLQDYQARLSRRLRAFAAQVAADRGFSMKLLVEQQRSASEVSEIASRFMGPMGFSLLEVTDSSFRLLSSGHFPASVGKSAARKAEMLEEQPVFVMDNIRGRKVLTLQSRIDFTIAERTFWCLGGVEVDESFLNSLTPASVSNLLLQKDGELIGGDGIETMSPLSDNEVIINDTPFQADTLRLSYRGEDGDAPVLYLLLDRPGSLSPLAPLL